MSDGKKDGVVFLAFRNNKPTEITEFLTCGTCKNKTFSAVWDGTNEFPKMKCAACGEKMGYFGWVEPEEDAKKPS